MTVAASLLAEHHGSGIKRCLLPPVGDSPEGVACDMPRDRSNDPNYRWSPTRRKYVHDYWRPYVVCGCCGLRSEDSWKFEETIIKNPDLTCGTCQRHFYYNGIGKNGQPWVPPKNCRKPGTGGGTPAGGAGRGKQVGGGNAPGGGQGHRANYTPRFGGPGGGRGAHRVGTGAAASTDPGGSAAAATGEDDEHSFARQEIVTIRAKLHHLRQEGGKEAHIATLLELYPQVAAIEQREADEEAERARKAKEQSPRFLEFSKASNRLAAQEARHRKQAIWAARKQVEHEEALQVLVTESEKLFECQLAVTEAARKAGFEPLPGGGRAFLDDAKRQAAAEECDSEGSSHNPGGFTVQEVEACRREIESLTEDERKVMDQEDLDQWAALVKTATEGAAAVQMAVESNRAAVGRFRKGREAMAERLAAIRLVIRKRHRKDDVETEEVPKPEEISPGSEAGTPPAGAAPATAAAGSATEEDPKTLSLADAGAASHVREQTIHDAAEKLADQSLATARRRAKLQGNDQKVIIPAGVSLGPGGRKGQRREAHGAAGHGDPDTTCR